MKILVLARGVPSKEYPLNGIFEMDQAKALAGLGHEIIYCALDMRSIRRRRKYGVIKEVKDNIKIYEYSFPIGGVGSRILDISGWLMFQKLYKLIVKECGKPDIIHGHFARSCGYILVKAKKKYNIDYVITEHDSVVNKNQVTQYEKQQLIRTYNCALGRIAVSQYLSERLGKLYNQKFTYIPNIVDISSFIDATKKEHEGINVVTVGRLEYLKGMDVLIKGFKLSKTNENINKLIIIGDGKEKDNLMLLAKNLGISDYVNFVGYKNRKDIKRYFEISDIFALSSRNETFGVVYIEAMCAGLPVIATRCGGPNGIFTINEGKYVPINDEKKLGEAILDIAENLGDYDAKRIKQFCVDHYSPIVVARKVEKILKGNIYE